MMLNKVRHLPLYVFTLIGVLVWSIVYVLTPAKPVIGISIETSVYVFSSFFAFFFSYFALSFFFKRSNIVVKYPVIISKRVIWFLVFVLILTWLIRYYDLFFCRGISFFNSIKENRALLGGSKLNIVYVLASVFKELYFFPLLLTLICFKKDKVLITVSSLLFLCPLLIPFLRGTRKDIFLVFILLGIILFISKTIFFKIKTILMYVAVFLFLNVLFYQVLIHRESSKFSEEKNTSEEILNKAIYNDLYKPTDRIKTIIESSEGTKKAVIFNTLHLAQYYCHGVFELNYLINEKLVTKDYHNGYYTSYLMTRFFDKLNIIKLNPSLLRKNRPRQNTYITFLGSLFLDYGWFGIFFMCLLGGIQRIIDEKILNGSFLYIGLYAFFIIFNVMLPVIDLLRGIGSYIVFSSVVLIMVFGLINKSKFRRIIE